MRYGASISYRKNRRREGVAETRTKGGRGPFALTSCIARRVLRGSLAWRCLSATKKKERRKHYIITSFVFTHTASVSVCCCSLKNASSIFLKATWAIPRRMCGPPMVEERPSLSFLLALLSLDTPCPRPHFHDQHAVSGGEEACVVLVQEG